MSLQQLADKAGLSKSWLQNYTRKKEPQKPGVDVIVALASALNVSTDWLLGVSHTRDIAGTTAQNLSLVELSAKLVVEQFIGALNVTHNHCHDINGFSLFKEGKLYGISADELAADYGYRIMKLYSDLRAGTVDRDQVKVVYDADATIPTMALDPPKLNLKP